MKKERQDRKQMIPAILLSCAMSFMLCLYAPMELYLTNVSDFWFDIYVLFPVMVVVFVLFAILGSVVLLILQHFLQKQFSYILSFVFSIFIALYVQGNYLVANLPVLDGSIPKWEHYDTDRAISAIVWIFIVGVFLVIGHKLKIERLSKVVSFGSVGIMLMLLFTGIVLVFSGDGLKHKQMVVVTTENEFEMSTDTNFIVLIVDSVDSRAYDAVFDKHPEYASWFEDFTYFSNTVSGYPFTVESVPFIFSGVWYENERSFDEYLTEVYSKAPLFDKLETLNYDMGMYSTFVGMAEDECIYRFLNVKDCAVGGIEDYQGFVKVMLQYVGFRYLPYQLKEICFNNMTTEFGDFRRLPDEYEMVRDFNNDIFYGKMQNENVISLTEQKVFKCLHLEGAHAPFKYNQYVEQVDNATYESSVEASMTIVHTYLEHLKESGVYDNSVIVVMADHGYEENYISFPRYNAFLMVKGIGESKDYEISEAPISHADMAQAFDRLLDGAHSDAIFDWKEGDERQRRHMWYYYDVEAHMEEYMIGTDARDIGTAYLTGQVYEK